MATLLEVSETLELADQHVFNVTAWEKVLENDFLRESPSRIETDELGHIILLPPPTPEHGVGQSKLVVLLRKLMMGGEVITECPVSTSGGVKGVDVAWVSDTRWQPQQGQVCLTQTPEICIEVVSPSNSRRETSKKKRLYFEAGAEEVWFREGDGRMAFYRKDDPDRLFAISVLCPSFPAHVG